MESPVSDHSDSDSGESWTLLDNDAAHNTDSPLLRIENLENCIIEDTCDKDEDTDGISIISDSEPESPFHTESSVIINSNPERQAIEEEIPVYSAHDIDVETNVPCEGNNDTEPLVEDDEIAGESIKHKIYVHRRNNRLSTVLNIIMLVSVMTAAGVAIGHMWGVKHDCPPQATPSFNKILSDLYKLQAENANYRNKLRELSLIIEDYLHNECERESEVSLNRQQTANCRQQKIHNIQKYLKSNLEEGKRNKRSFNSYQQKEEENKIKKPNQTQLPLHNNVSKIKPIKKGEIDKILVPEIIVTEPSLEHEKFEFRSKEDTPLKETKVTYADSLKSHNINIIEDLENQNAFQYNVKNVKTHKKAKITQDEKLEASSSEEEFVKDRHYTLKRKLKQTIHSNRKPVKNTKRKNKHENWDLKEGILKYYDDVSTKTMKGDDIIQNKIIQDKTRNNKQQVINDGNDDKLHVYDEYFRQEGPGKKFAKHLNWYENRAQVRKEARKRQQQELLNVSTISSGEWYFKRMHKREESRDKENSTCKGNLKRKNFKTKPYK